MREEVELLSSGLASCLLNGKEVRILKISPESITVRLSEEADEISKLVVAFYMFKENSPLFFSLTLTAVWQSAACSPLISSA